MHVPFIGHVGSSGTKELVHKCHGHSEQARLGRQNLLEVTIWQYETLNITFIQQTLNEICYM